MIYYTVKISCISPLLIKTMKMPALSQWIKTKRFYAIWVVCMEYTHTHSPMLINFIKSIDSALNADDDDDQHEKITSKCCFGIPSTHNLGIAMRATFSYGLCRYLARISSAQQSALANENIPTYLNNSPLITESVTHSFSLALLHISSFRNPTPWENNNGGGMEKKIERCTGVDCRFYCT